MRPRFVIVMSVILALAVPATMLAQQSKAEKEVRVVIDELQQANLKGGAEAASIFDKCYEDNFVRILSDGKIFNKADTLNIFRSGSVRFESFSLSDVKIRLYGKMAVVTGVATKKETFMGGSRNWPNRWTQVFVKRGGNWKCVLYQSTRIAEPAKQ
jgi:hypothetical protein